MTDKTRHKTDDTDAEKCNLIPKELTAKETSIIFANEVDVLNMTLLGKTAKSWCEQNPY